MEIFIGSMITLVVLVVINRFIRHTAKNDIPINIRYSQSHVHQLLVPFLPDNEDMQPVLITQASKYYDKINIRVVFAQNKAYWIQDNTFYVADIVDGEVDQSTAAQVDIMSMDRVQLDKMMLIVEKLTEGTTNDYWSAG